VVIELSRAGEQQAEAGLLVPSLREALSVGPDHPIFVPSVIFERGGNRTTIHLMEGYVFVATGLTETAYFNLERNCPYVKQVLSTDSPSGIRTLSTIQDSDVCDMRRQLREHVATDLEVGMRVLVTQGLYEGLEAEIKAIEGDEATVLFVLRSIEIIDAVPKVFLDPMDQDGGAEA
jgi:transcription antitermination factor NusG